MDLNHKHEKLFKIIVVIALLSLIVASFLPFFSLY